MVTMVTEVMKVTGLAEVTGQPRDFQRFSGVIWEHFGIIWGLSGGVLG